MERKTKPEEENCYQDIINLPHHVSTVHPQMSGKERAAQFSPFAALPGFDEYLKEAARVTDQKAELTEGETEKLNGFLKKLEERYPETPLVEITYFLEDKRKSGGFYRTVKTRIKKIRGFEKELLLLDGTRISFSNLYEIKLCDIEQEHMKR